MTKITKSILLAVALLGSVRGQTINPFDGKLTLAGLVQKGASLPANCTPTQAAPLFVVNTGVSLGLYICSATNTWTNVGTVTGSGILTLNGNASTAQVIAAGTTGADINVAAAGGTVTIHVPTASGSVRGALSAADWTTFNSKAPATSGTAMLKGNGSGGFSNAVSATDYAPATTGSSMLKASSGGFANAVAGTDYVAATTGGEIQKASSGGLTTATAGTDFAKPNTSSTWSAQQTFQHNVVVSGASGTLNVSAAAASKPFVQGLSSAIPATCAVGDTYFKTDAGAGSNLFGCTSTNTWTLLGGGAGDFVGPASSTAGHFVTYGDTTGKLGADSLALVTSVGSPGTDTNVPSEAAVRSAISAAGGGNVNAGGTLTANLPVIGAGTTAVSVGTKSGNNTAFVTYTGTLTAGIPTTWDANGNITIMSGQIAATYGGTNNAFFQVSGPASTIKTYTFPNASSTMAALGTAQSWTAKQSFGSGNMGLLGASAGETLLVPAAAASGTITVPALTAVMATVVGTNHAPLISQGTSAQAVSMAAGTTGQVVRGVTGSDPAWSTTTWPDTATANRLLYVSATNVISDLASANNAILVTSAAGVPSLAAPTSPLAVSSSALTCTTCVVASAPGAGIAHFAGSTQTVTSSAVVDADFSGQLTMAKGGSNANLTASNGGIVYSTASAMAILAGTANASRPLLSGSSTTPSWAAFSLPSSVTSGGIPYFSSTSAMSTSALLTQYGPVYGGGAGAAPVSAAAGTTGQVFVGNTGAAPGWATVSQAIDNIGSTRGSILYRGVSGWAALTPGTSGYVLQSGGAGADPSYAAISGVISGLAGVHALVTSASSTSIETLNSSAVMDASGNITTPGTMTTGSGTGQSGQISLTAGTAPASPPANSVSFAAPSAITTAYTLTLPTAAAAADSVPMFTSAGVGSFVALTGASGTIPRVAGTLTVASSTTLAVTGGVSIGIAGSGTPSLTLPAAVTFVGANALSITTTAPTNATLPAGTVTLMSDPMTTNGDMIARAAGAATRVAGSSTANQPLLSVVGGLPVWGGVSLPPTTVTSGGILYASSTTALASSGLLTQYGVVYGGGAGATPAATAGGTTGQLLVATTSAAPAWTTATYPSSTTINRILYSSSANAVGEISAVNGGMLNANSSGVPAMTITPILGVPATSAGSLTLAAATGAGAPTLKAQNNTTSYDLALPTGAGTAGYALGNSGTPGVLTWIELTGTGTVNSGTATQLAYYATTTNAVSGNANATISNGALTLGQAGSVIGQLILPGNTSGTVTVTPAAAAGTWTLTLPTDDGTDGQLLKTNGSGVTSWVTATGTGDVLSTAANTYTAGMKQTMSHSATTAGLNLGNVSGNPSSLADGDIWLSAGGNLKFRTATTTYTIANLEAPVLYAPYVDLYLRSNAPTATIGTAGAPFASVFIGGAATNNIQLTGTAATAKVITLPGQTGTVTVAPTTTTANQHFVGTATAGLGAWSTSTYADTFAAGTVLAAGTANTVAGTATPTLGVQSTTAGSLTIAGAGTTNPSITLNGYTSGTGVLSVTATGTAITTSVPLSPTSAGGTTVGLAALPFSSVYIGGAATNNIRLTGTSAAARVATIPDVAADSTFVMAATSTTTTQALFASSTAGLGTYRAIAVADLPTVDKTRNFTMVIPGTGTSNVLQDTDDQPAVWYNSLGQGITITSVSCITDSATATTIQLQKNDGSLTNMLSSNLSCSSTRASTTGFVSGENAMASTTGLDFLTVSAGGAGKWVSVTVTYTLD